MKNYEISGKNMNSQKFSLRLPGERSRHGHRAVRADREPPRERHPAPRVGHEVLLVRIVEKSLLYIPEQTYPSRSRTRYAKKNKNDTFRTRYAKKKSRVPPQLGGSVFEAAEGLREFRVPGTRFFFVRGGVREKIFFAYP